MLPIFKQLEEMFMRYKADEEINDEVDDEVDDETDDEIDMSELESEESAAQRTEQKRQELKILTPQQMLNRLPIFLVQLKARNNL